MIKEIRDASESGVGPVIPRCPDMVAGVDQIVKREKQLLLGGGENNVVQRIRPSPWRFTEVTRAGGPARLIVGVC